jgi:hypothetical protein
MNPDCLSGFIWVYDLSVIGKRLPLDKRLAFILFAPDLLVLIRTCVTLPLVRARKQRDEIYLAIALLSGVLVLTPKFFRSSTASPNPTQRNWLDELHKLPYN